MRNRWIVVLPAVGLMTGLLATAPQAMARTAPRGMAQAAPQGIARTSGGTSVHGRTVHTVTLVTGDRVALTETPQGRPQVTIVPATKGAAFQVMTLRNQVYVVPQSAAGNLGSPLDLSLFDVTRLIADGYANTGKPLRLSISYAPGARHRLPPGFSRARNGSVSVSRSGSRQFSGALAALARAGRRYASTASGQLFAGVTRISLAGAAPKAPSPPGRLYTLTVKGLDRLGRPVNGTFADVMSVDNVNNFLADQSFYQGVLKYSLPAGNYTIASFIPTFEANGTVDYSLVVLPQVSVSHDTVVVLDASKASRFQVSTPRPSSTVTAQLHWQRNDASGVPFSSDFVSFGAIALYQPAGGR